MCISSFPHFYLPHGVLNVYSNATQWVKTANSLFALSMV
uniref:Uncharacterized protein n=1 Tax=Nelumbo nucifera TaxID=4432 RepID=A0A822XE18_NELNU|nr:TPA_asm: hypothetical protein HUJ06_019366 [Nelumbo nucifera]